MNEDIDEQDLLVLEEIRWESILRTSMCDCSPDGDGPPCPHGNYMESPHERATEADIAKKILEDWVYEEEEDKYECAECGLGDHPTSECPNAEAIPEEENEESQEGLINWGASTTKLGGEASDKESEWVFDEVSQEWKEQ